MEEEPRPSRAKNAAKKSVKVTGLAIGLFVFILILLFILGIVIDRFFIAPTHI